MADDMGIKNKKTVYLIAYYFPPINTIASERTLKIALSLIERGYYVVIFMLDLSDVARSSIDSGDRHKMLNDKSHCIVHVKMDIVSPWNTSQNKIIGFFQKAFFYLNTRYISGDFSFLWLRPLLKNLKKQYKLNKPEIILATGNPYFSFWAPYYMKKKYDIPYWLDFRDLWLKNPQVKRMFLAKFIVKKVEKTVVENADILTTVSKGCKEVLDELYNVDTKVLYNFPNKEYVDYINSLSKTQRNSVVDSTKINLCFAGTIYLGESSFFPIFEALMKMPKVKRDLFRIHYLGSRSSWVIREFRKYGLEDILIDYGFVDKQIALEVMWNSDILISLIHNDVVAKDAGVRGIISTKIFDYVVTKKPILNICPSNSEVNELLHASEENNFYSFHSEQISDIHEFLLKFLIGGSQVVRGGGEQELLIFLSTYGRSRLRTSSKASFKVFRGKQ